MVSHGNDYAEHYRVTGLTRCFPGSQLYGGAVGAEGQLERAAVRAGIFDDLDVLHGSKPVIEIYTAQRLRWIEPVEGCEQYDGMLPSS